MGEGFLRAARRIHNQLLRAAPLPESRAVRDQLQSWIDYEPRMADEARSAGLAPGRGEELRNWLYSHELPSDLELWRGFNSGVDTQVPGPASGSIADYAEYQQRLAQSRRSGLIDPNVRAGDRLIGGHFTSGSLHPDAAMSFVGPPSVDPYMLRIQAPRGTRGAAVRDGDYNNLEVLLPPHSLYEVTGDPVARSVPGVSHSAYRELPMRMVDQQANPFTPEQVRRFMGYVSGGAGAAYLGSRYDGDQ